MGTTTTHILAIDNGTQSVRALLFDLRGNLVDKAQVAMDTYRSPQPGWVENDPQEFWLALCRVCQNLWAKTSVPKSSICCARKLQHGNPDHPWFLDGELVIEKRSGTAIL